MITLKSLLTEETVFTLSPTDAWEYKYDMKNTGIPWWTRKKGTEEWIDMQSTLSSDQYQQAVRKLTTAVKNKTIIKPKMGILPKPDSDSDYNKLIEIATDLTRVITLEPQNYFKKFKGTFNDSEAEAAEWLYKEFYKAWGSELKRLEQKGLRTGVNDIVKAEAEARRMILGQSRRPYTFKITGPGNKQKTFTIKWTYF